LVPLQLKTLYPDQIGTSGSGIGTHKTEFDNMENPFGKNSNANRAKILSNRLIILSKLSFYVCQFHFRLCQNSSGKGILGKVARAFLNKGGAAGVIDSQKHIHSNRNKNRFL